MAKLDKILFRHLTKAAEITGRNITTDFWRYDAFEGPGIYDYGYICGGCGARDASGNEEAMRRGAQQHAAACRATR